MDPIHIYKSNILYINVLYKYIIYVIEFVLKPLSGHDFSVRAEVQLGRSGGGGEGEPTRRRGVAVGEEALGVEGVAVGAGGG